MPHHQMPLRSSGEPTAGSEGFLSQFGRSTESTEFYSPMPDGYVPGRTAFVAVMGTVMSGLGKGIFSASLAKLIKDKGLRVAPVKLEGYLNVDSGTLNPYRHGEVFVLDDGTECDMDLGTYERLLDQNLTRSNFTTAGQIYSGILDRERRGGYLGRDVQMIPHVTGEVKRRLRSLAMTGGGNGQPADVVFVEVGGTVGDYENSFYIEALRELAFEEGRENFCFVALTYVLEPPTLGEQKSKAAQLGIKRLMESGIQPQLIACRAERPVTETVRQKVAMFTNVPLPRVFSMHDRDSIYSIPEAMRAESLDREVLTILDRHHLVKPVDEDRARGEWQSYATSINAPRKHSVNLGILGKYTALRDAYASIDKAIEHSCTHLSIDANVKWIDVTELTSDRVDAELVPHDLHAVIVPGGFGERGVEGKIAGVKWIREQQIPFLGICLGFQVAVIEYARHVAGIPGAHSTEFRPDGPDAVISELPEQKEIEGLGGTMRLGGQDVALTPDSLASHLYGGVTDARERFRHRYEVEPAHIAQLEAAGLRFSGRHPAHPIMQVLELPTSMHPYFIGAQFHPELTSRPLRPQPMFMGLLAAAIRRAHPNLDRTQISTRWLPEDDGSDDGDPAAAVPRSAGSLSP
ncbi:MAG: CTP synthase [Planctomycetes bacterium]|nr:CTP synthase [Planctomycetota bacterium]MCP4839089.1 CTP synthase [Planctomycetota bacterium]